MLSGVNAMIRRIVKGFLVGGLMGLIGQVIFLVISKTAIPSDMIVPATMLTYGFVSVALILSGLYFKLAAFGGHGADLPISGLMFGAAMTCADAKRSGRGTLASFFAGFWMIMKILGAGFVVAFVLGLVLGPYKGSVPVEAPSLGMQFLWAFVVCGLLCAFAQLLTEAKVPFPIVAMALIAIGGGLLTRFGVLDTLNTLTGAGATVTAVGCGNGAYGTGILAAAGIWVPFLITVLLNCVLVAMGSLCGLALAGKNPDK